MGLQQFSVGKTNCSDFALSGPVYVCLCVCVSLYTVSVCRKASKQAKWTTIPCENRISVCVCVCVCQIWEREDRENTRIRLCVYVCVRESVSERERGKRAASPLFSRAGYQAARQQGGIITEAVTFLWFLWFQHEAGGRLWLTHDCTVPAWKLLARGQYMTFLGHFNLRRINYRTMNHVHVSEPLARALT